MADEKSAENPELGLPTPAPRKTIVAGEVAKQLGSAVFCGASSVLILTVNKTVLSTYQMADTKSADVTENPNVSAPTPSPRKTMFVGKVAKQLGSAVFFGISSILIITVNKTVLTTYHFPSFQVVGLGQIVAIMTILWTAKTLKFIEFPDPSVENIKRVFPLPVFYILNLIFGLGGTQQLNLPMFTVLRRFTLLLIVLGQIVVLGKHESLAVYVSIFMMIAGALIAAVNDLAFNLYGYCYVMLNNGATAAQTLYTKKKMNADMGKYEIMFYNAIIVVIPAVLIAGLSGDLTKAYYYDGWTNPFFLINFFLSCVMGFVLIYATILCTQLTSPLTLTVVGCIKNVFVTYAGMFIGGDYVFEVYNFIGINVSVFASLVYSYYKYKEQNPQQPQPKLQEDSSETNSRDSKP